MTELRKDMVTALVDSEITDSTLKQEILSKIESDKDFAIEYKVQSLIKNIVKDKVEWRKTPDKVKAKVLRSIGSQTKVAGANKIFLLDFFEKPAFSFATAFVVILAIILIILNRTEIIEKKNFAIQQSGSDNMFIQAKNNFNSILNGKLVPQLTSANSEEIKNFFTTNGVKYSASVPNLKDWKLLGAVVSEDKGEKFAHHVYVGKNGELVYLFQVDESYIQTHTIVSLSEDLVKYLNGGNCYTSESDGSVTLFTKLDNNICAIVSNGNPKEIENTFCGL